MNFKRACSFIYILMVCLTASLSLSAQVEEAEFRPIVRLHAADSPFAPYDDSLLSGFLQSGGRPLQSGFLQIPFVGDPVWIYVGEKDSTQFMAYSSGFQVLPAAAPTRSYSYLLERYGVRADITTSPTRWVQRYTFPDTLADKGFLIDIDHSATGAGCEDMDFYFVDRRTVEAHKRGYADSPQQPDEFYYARFSHTFKTFNIRREKVKLADGTSEARCKAAFTFDLKPGEVLTVESSVSSVSAAQACLQLTGANPPRSLAQARKKRPAPVPEYVASNTSSSKTSSTQPPVKPRVNPKKPVDRTLKPPRPTTAVAAAEQKDPWSDVLEVGTVDASLRAAFFTALGQLRGAYSEINRKADAAPLLKLLLERYPQDLHPQADAAATDSLLRSYARNLLHGKAADGTAFTNAHALWFVANAIGFRPAENGEVAIVRPLFNVVTLHYTGGRRLVFHTRGNTPQRQRVTRPRWNGAALPAPAIASSELLKGGILQVNCEK
ncbi:MAG: glycoside hydrolase domain-containing protein [Alloprevotella sp.]